MNTPLVSVIIPTYNRCKFLSASIKSVLSQSYQNLEVLVVDNASNDLTKDMLEGINDVRVKVYRNEFNIGSAANYNRACKLATGEYIHFFSDDDLMLPMCIEKKVNLALKENLSLVHSGILIINSNCDVISKEHWAKEFIPNLESISCFSQLDNFKNLYYNWNFISLPSVLMKTNELKKLNYLDSQLTYLIDWELWLKASLFFKFGFLNEPLVSYRFHESNTISEAGRKKEFEEALMMRKQLRNAYKNHQWIVGGVFMDYLISFSQRLKYDTRTKSKFQRLLNILLD